MPVFVGRTEARGARILSVGPDFFATMGIRIVQGRAIDERDAPGRAPVVVVSELFARTFFDGQPAVGRHLTLDVPQTVTVARAMGATGPIDLEGTMWRLSSFPVGLGELSDLLVGDLRVWRRLLAISSEIDEDNARSLQRSGSRG